MDKVQKPSDSECYTPSSEPYRFYLMLRTQTMEFSFSLAPVYNDGRVMGRIFFPFWFDLLDVQIFGINEEFLPFGRLCPISLFIF
jgi:hypothetical protein